MPSHPIPSNPQTTQDSPDPTSNLMHPATRTATAQSSATLKLSLSQQSTISLEDTLPPATAGNQVPPEVRARYLAARRGEVWPAESEADAERQRPRGAFARFLAAFKPSKSRVGDTYGRFTVSTGGGYEKRQYARTAAGGCGCDRRREVYGGLM